MTETSAEPEQRTALMALKEAMAARGTPPEAVAYRCNLMFGKSKFSELTDQERWTLVCALDPSIPGPWGHSMAPFEPEEDAPPDTAEPQDPPATAGPL